MRRSFIYAAFFLLAACTQQPAEYIDKGDMFFGKDGNVYSYDRSHVAIIPNGYQEKASIGHVGTSDLKPVTAGKSVPFTAPAFKEKYVWPVTDGHVLSHFSTHHDGINIGSTEGAPIHAVAEGTVVYAGNELKDYGNMVIVRHANGFMSAYAHASKLAVKKKDRVKQSDVLGYVGKSGGVKQPQLHFGMRDGKQAIDPELYLPKR